MEENEELDGQNVNLDEELANYSDEEFENILNNANIKANQPEPENEQEESSESDEVEEQNVNTSSEEREKSEVTESNTNIDYESAYKSIFKPFKANGKEITPHTVNDVVSLMQMGANYTKKMQTIAPMKKTIESLNKANIKEEDLNFLIDLHNGNVDAIKTLLKRNNIDPIELDVDNNTYTPNKNNIVSDSEVEFSEVLDDVRDNIGKINEIINNKWDSESKNKLLNNPKLIKSLNEEIQLGRFDDIQNILDEERTYGRYKGISDLDAYSDIVTKIVNYRLQQQRQQQSSRTNRPNTQTTRNTPDKTKAAPIRSKTKNQGRPMTSEDIFSMSDEEFNKLSERDLF